jgi:recombination protein RecT
MEAFIMATQETLQQQLTEKKEPTTFPAMLKTFLLEIQRALPKHLNGDRMARIALTASRRTPKLMQCDPRSVFAAVIQASQLGLEPDSLGRAYLIPYGTECQFVPGWKGLVDLVNRSGQGTIWTGAVFEGDEFDYQLGDSPYVKHKPGIEDDASKITHVYAIGRTKGAEWPIIEVWPIKRVWKHRDRYNKVGKRHYSFENEEMYARKVVLLQVIKYMPASAELVSAMSLNEAAEKGNQNLTVKDAIEGTWVPAPDDDKATSPSVAENAASDSKQAAASEKAKIVLTYAVVAEKIEKAKTLEVLYEAADLIGEVADEKHRAELTAIYKRREQELG